MYLALDTRRTRTSGEIEATWIEKKKKKKVGQYRMFDADGLGIACMELLLILFSSTYLVRCIVRRTPPFTFFFFFWHFSISNILVSLNGFSTLPLLLPVCNPSHLPIYHRPYLNHHYHRIPPLHLLYPQSFNPSIEIPPACLSFLSIPSPLSLFCALHRGPTTRDSIRSETGNPKLL